MATLAGAGITLAGTTYTLVAAAGGGDTIPGGDHAFLVVNNGGSSPITVTVSSAATCSQGGTHNLVVSVSNGVTKMIGPLPTGRFGDPVSITYSAVTSVTVGGFVV